MNKSKTISVLVPVSLLPQCHPKLPVSLQDVPIENLHSQPAGRDQGPLGPLLHLAVPEGERSMRGLAGSHLDWKRSLRFCCSFVLRVIWLTGTSRGKCGITCLERRCLRFSVSLQAFLCLSFWEGGNHV